MPAIKIGITKFSKRQVTRKQTAINDKKTHKDVKQIYEKEKTKNKKVRQSRATNRKRGTRQHLRQMKSQEMMQFWTLRGISSRGGIRM
jgi:hypothetical protein